MSHADLNMPPDMIALAHTPAADAFALSDKGRQVLRLWDALQDIELEKALLEAEADLSTSDGMPAVAQGEQHRQIALLEKEVLDAQALFALRQQVSRTVLITDPLLKAVHSSPYANSVEAGLGPLIRERDVLSLYLSAMNTNLVDSYSTLYDLEAQVTALNESNSRLAAQVLDLVKETQSDIRAEAIQDPALKRDFESATNSLDLTRRRLRNVRGILQGIIQGSGIDWVNADGGKWVDYVADEEDETHEHSDIA